MFFFKKKVHYIKKCFFLKKIQCTIFENVFTIDPVPLRGGRLTQATLVLDQLFP